MMKTKLPTVTLLGVDCVDIERLIVAAEICKEHFEFASIKLLSSKESSNSKDVVKIHDIPTIEDYSKFMITELDSYVDTEHVLIIQYDGFILNPQAWTDEFLKYDYIGPPWIIREWAIKKFGIPGVLLDKVMVGNGGFSLRSKKFISTCSKLSNEGLITEYNPEDVVMCIKHKKLLEDNDIVIAPISVAQQFAFEGEGLDKGGWDGQFGFHGFRWTDISNWTKDHPEHNFDKFMK